MGRIKQRFGFVQAIHALALGILLFAEITGLSRAQAPPDVSDLTPYETAQLFYKTGHFQEALDTLNRHNATIPAGQVEQVLVLKARILTELQQYSEGEKLLLPLLTSTAPIEVQLAMGDLLLRKGDGSGATKFYNLALQSKPNDPDITLKLIYALIISNDLVTAEKYTSQMKPFDVTVDPLDAKNPSTPSYYFAKAALAHATGKEPDAENDIEPVRTLYGSTITDRYLKTYLELFAKPVKIPAEATAPASATNAPPVNAKP